MQKIEDSPIQAAVRRISSILPHLLKTANVVACRVLCVENTLVSIPLSSMALLTQRLIVLKHTALYGSFVDTNKLVLLKSRKPFVTFKLLTTAVAGHTPFLALKKRISYKKLTLFGPKVLINLSYTNRLMN